MKRIVLLVCFFTIILTSCAGRNVEVNLDPVNVTGEISVYYLEDDKYYEKSVKLFRDIYTNVVVNETKFKTIEELSDKVKSETGTGEGPDVLLFYSDMDIDPGRFMDSGILEPLDGYLLSDESYKPENYSEKMMAAGVFDENQYIIPITFNIPSFSTTQEKLDRASISLPEDYTYDELISVFTEDMKRLESDVSDISIIPFNVGNISDIWNAGGIMRDLNVNSQEFKNTMEFVRLFANQEEKVSEFYTKYGQFSEFYNLNQHVNFYYNQKNFVYNSYFMESFLGQASEGETPRTLMVPTYADKDKYIGVISRYAALNANSNNKNTAYAFLKKVMETNDGAGHDVWRHGELDIPVNKEHLDLIIKDYKYSAESRGNIGGGIYFHCDNLTLEGEQQIKAIFDGMEAYMIPNGAIKNMIDESMQDYFKDKRSYDDCLTELTQKLDLYMNE